MKISKLHQYKNASKILIGMLAVTMSIGMITDFSWKEVASSVKNFGVSVVAFAEPNEEQGGEDFDQAVHELTTIAEWKYKDEDENCIYVKIKHTEDIKQIEDEDGKERVMFDEGVRDVVAKYKLKEGDTKFRIVDVNGDYQWVNIDNIELNVSRAYKNENGDIIAIAMKTKTKRIKKVTYLDDLDNPDEIQVVNSVLGQEGKTSHPIDHYEVDKGTTGVLVYLEDEEIPYEVQLSLDWKAPDVDRVYRNAANTKMLIKAMDNESGIDKIYVDGRLITIDGTSREVTEIIKTGVTQVKLYDAVGHETVVNAEEDSIGPKVVLEKLRDEYGLIQEGKFRLTIRDHKSGLWKVETDSAEGQLMWDCTQGLEGVELYPQSSQELPLDLKADDMIGITKIYAYDALGNVAEIDLENIDCVIVYTHSNLDGSKIAISLYEEGKREIDKIGILNSAKECKIIEQMPEHTRRVLRWYETPKDTTAIKVFYKTDDPEINKPVEYILDPYEEIPEVVGTRAISLVGINRVEYSDGRKVEFNDSMPTSVNLQLVQGGSAVVYDSLDNCNIVE